jgi:methyl-accepting chemotaxis protein
MSSSLSDYSERIAANVGEVVSSIQFHDIVRQQIEHISLVLEESRSMMAENQESPEPGEQAEEIVAWTADVCRLQSHQSEATQKEFVQAIDQIWTSLENINADVVELQNRVHSTSICGQGQRLLTELESRIMNFLEPLQQGCGFLEEVMQSMGSMADTVAEMGAFISHVEEVGEEIELIALNASIRAAHTGDRGLALGVLAEAIRKLSVESGDKVAEVSRALRKINDQADQLHQDAEKTREASRKEEHLSARLNEIVQSLRQTNAGVEVSLNEVQEAGLALNRSLEELIGNRDVDREVVSELTRARDALSEIEAQARELVPEYESPERSERLQSLLNRYTMESERLVHMAFSGLGNEEQADEVIWESEDGDSEFGDNVELF